MYCEIDGREYFKHELQDTEKRVENTTRIGIFLTKLEVFDISFQSKLKLRRKRRIEIIKIYAN